MAARQSATMSSVVPSRDHSARKSLNSVDLVVVAGRPPVAVAGAVDGRRPRTRSRAARRRPRATQVVDPLVAGGAVAEEHEGPGPLGVGRGPEDAGHGPPVDLDREAALDDAVDVDAVGVARPVQGSQPSSGTGASAKRPWLAGSLSGSGPGGMSVGPTSPTMLGSSTPTPVPRRRSIRLSPRSSSGCSTSASNASG